MWVLVSDVPYEDGQQHNYRIVGPFGSADEAREVCNTIGIPGLGFEVVKLSQVTYLA